MKASTQLALVMWASVIVLTWLLVLRVIPLDALSASAWVFFLIFAIAAAAVGSESNKRRG